MTNAISDDGALIERLQAGDNEALGELYDCYRSQVYRTALAITHDTAAAEDILQECFLKVHAYADRIDTSVPLAPWLYRVTVNLSYTWTVRRKKRRISLDAFIDRLVSPARHSPEPTAERTEIQEAVQRAIDALPFGQKVVIVLHYLNGLSLKEIAYILDCPVGTVKSRLYYGRENLREALGPTSWLSDVAHSYT
jgi:RNA polymerase sigma-70 factor (ECF subfamily)